ncbi:MAG: phage portal protein [Acidobacteria bacterium]|nr:MAG: phage portal protein [Acidobacteriota bacterium]
MAAPAGMSVPPVQPWKGWPGEWATPPWNGPGGGLWGQYVSTVYTCVDLLARSIASFPTYRMRGVQHMGDLPWMENPEPELYAGWVDFAKQLVDCIYLRGEGIVYALARYENGTVARMCVLNPDALTAEWSQGEIVWRIGERPIPADDLCVIPYQSFPGALRGISPLSWIGRNLIGAEALERYQAELAAGGGVPWGTLTTPGQLTAAQADENRQRWIDASARRGTAPAILSGGLKLETLTLSPTDMALLELRIFDEQRICAAFGVPPYLVGLPQAEGLTYANATSLFDYFWRSALRPITRSIAQALSGWALPLGQRIEFNADEFTRPDFADRANAYATLHAIHDPDTGARAITVEEIRLAERLAPMSAPPLSSVTLSGPYVQGGAT